MDENTIERFAPDVQQMLASAHEDAEYSHCQYIEPQHLLIALIRANVGVFRVMGLELYTVEKMLRQTLSDRRRTANEVLTLSDPTKKTLELALNEAKRLDSHQIQIEHLVLGLASPKNDAVTDLLKGFPFTPEEIYRRSLRDLLKPSFPVESATAFKGPFLRATVPYLPNRWRVTVIYAIVEAKRLKQSEVGVEHLLFALLSDEEDGTSMILRSVGLSLDEVRELLPQNPSPNYNTDESPKFSQSLREVFGLAAVEAFDQGFIFLLTYHLLLGLLQQNESAAIDILNQQNVDLEKLVKAIRDSLQ